MHVRALVRDGVSLIEVDGEELELAVGGAVRTVRCDVRDIDGALAEADREQDGWLLVRLVVESPSSWDEAHPEELVGWEDGTVRRPGLGVGKETLGSPASAAWRRWVAGAAHDFVAAWESERHGGRTIAYVLASGVHDAWIPWGVEEGWLRDHGEAMRRAFEETTGFEAPSAARRVEVDLRGFRDPRGHADVIAYDRFAADCVADTILLCARSVKGAFPHRKPVGVLHGDLLRPAAWPEGLQRGGPHALDRLLDADVVDFMMIPVHDADGVLVESGPRAAVIGRGKPCLGETRLDGTAGPAPVALVVDDHANLHVQRPVEQFRDLVLQQAAEIARTGLPFDLVRIRDLHALGPYRLLVFPNAFFVGAEDRAWLQNRFRDWGAVTVWCVAPGFSDGETVAFENAASLTGIEIRKPDAPHRAVVDATWGDVTLRFGSEFLHAHTPHVTDPAAVTVGRYADSGLAGLAARRHGAWTTVYSAAPAVPARLLRSVFDGPRLPFGDGSA